TAVAQLATTLGRPAPGDRRAREIDHRIDALELAGVEDPSRGVPLDVALGAAPDAQQRVSVGLERFAQHASQESTRAGHCNLHPHLSHCGGSSTTRHRYHDATVRYGAHFTPSFATRSGEGCERSRYRRLI